MTQFGCKVPKPLLLIPWPQLPSLGPLGFEPGDRHFEIWRDGGHVSSSPTKFQTALELCHVPGNVKTLTPAHVGTDRNWLRHVGWAKCRPLRQRQALDSVATEASVGRGALETGGWSEEGAPRVCRCSSNCRASPLGPLRALLLSPNRY